MGNHLERCNTFLTVHEIAAQYEIIGTVTVVKNGVAVSCYTEPVTLLEGLK